MSTEYNRGYAHGLVGDEAAEDQEFDYYVGFEAGVEEAEAREPAHFAESLEC